MRDDAKSLPAALALLLAASAGPGLGAQLPMVEQQVERNILEDGVAPGVTVRDFGLPRAFVRRFADRIIKASFRERSYLVRGAAGGRAPATSDRRPDDVPYLLLEAVGPPPGLLAEGCPPTRGFRYPFLSSAGAVAPSEGRADERAWVGRTLAARGLLETTAELIQRSGAASIEDAAAHARAAGLPVDLLAAFDVDGDPMAVFGEVLARYAGGASLATVVAALGQRQFVFRRSDATFRPAYEDGVEPPAQLRMQLPRGDAWANERDGGAVDLLMQLCRALPSAAILAQIDAEHVGALDAALRREDAAGAAARVTVLPHAFTVDQWAQDNGKAGTVERGEGRVAATLAPRFASRREDASYFVPGENRAIAELARRGHPVVASPLLFQGGDLCVVRDPRRERNLLFVGEAEVHRNVALGLSQAQATEALRIEFGADDCVVLPSISFHLDYDVCFRRVEGQLVAFVADQAAAVRSIVDAALHCLLAAGLPEPDAERAAAALRRGERAAVLAVVGPFLARHADASRAFPIEFVRHFGRDHDAHAVGAFTRFLVALERIEGGVVPPEQKAGPGHRAALLRAHDRGAAAQAQLRRQLEAAGCRVVAVPALVDAAQSINPLNGLQVRDAYLMPAYGGVFADLDREAARVFGDACGKKARVVPIRCWESQHRLGALHCSVAVYPELIELR